MQKHSTRFELLDKSYREFGNVLYHFHFADKRAKAIELLKKDHYTLKYCPHYQI